MAITVRNADGNKVTVASTTQVVGGVTEHTPTYNVAPEPSTDPCFDHTNGAKLTVSTTQQRYTVPAGCKYVRIYTTQFIYVHTNNVNASNGAASVPIPAGTVEIVPVLAGTNFLSVIADSASATVWIMPYKVRP